MNRKEWLKENGRKEGDVMRDKEGEEYICEDSGWISAQNKCEAIVYLPKEMQDI